jgi:hypothetical protein
MSTNPFSDQNKPQPPLNPYDPSTFVMPPKKPGVLTAIGVMGVVLGVLGVMSSCMAVAALPFQSQLQTAFSQPSSKDPALRIQAEMNSAMAQVQQDYFAVSMTLSVLNLALSAWLLAGGIMVLRTRRAGRPLMIYALLTVIAFEVLRTVFGVIIQLEMMPITTDFADRLGREAAPNSPMASMGPMMKGAAIFGMVLGLIWPLGKIIMYALSARYLASKPIVEYFEKNAKS